MPDPAACGGAPGRLRVLLVAPGLRADGIGEVYSIFRIVEALHRIADLTLLVSDAGGAHTLAPRLPGAKIVIWPEPPLLAHRFERFNSMAKPMLPLFFARARRWIRRALAEGQRFDVAHQILPQAMRYPSPLRGLPLPTVIGPLGGSLETPAPFAHEIAQERGAARLRALDRWRFRNDPWLRASYGGADAVLGVAPYVQALLAEGGIPLRRFETMLERADEGAPPAAPPRPGKAGTLHALHVGRAVRTKGLRDVVRALAHLRDLPRVRLTSAGDGADLAACRQEAERLGVADRVRFMGSLPRASVDGLYREAEVFAFPSFREAMGGVVFEAMSHGLPVIAADRGGPAHLVDASAGIRIPVTDPEGYARAIGKALRRLAGDPALRVRLGQGARARLASFGSWDDRARWLESLYRDLPHPR